MSRTFRMSSDTSYAVCDGDDCARAINATDDELRRAGWDVLLPDAHYCPACKETKS